MCSAIPLNAMLDGCDPGGATLAAAFLESIIQHGITDHKARYVREAFAWADAFEEEVETRRLQWIEEQQSLKDDGLGGINTL